MHVISRKKLREFWEEHPDAEGPLGAWFKVAEKAQWEHFADLRSVYPHADLVGELTVINIGGNKYRLVIRINYNSGTVFIRHVLTHAEYDRGDWKKR